MGGSSICLCLLQEKLSRQWLLKHALPFHSVPPQTTFSDLQNEANTLPECLYVLPGPLSPHICQEPSIGYHLSQWLLGMTHHIAVCWSMKFTWFPTFPQSICIFLTSTLWQPGGENYVALVVARKVGGSEHTWEAEALLSGQLSDCVHGTAKALLS